MQTVTEPERTLPVSGEFEIIICGGGPAGISAACAAARRGRKTLLLERNNCLGGIWRAGTGTAMYYLWHSRDLGATADGRHAGEPFGTNFSPNLFTQVPGPLTDIQSFTKQHIERTINGGPLTLEFAAGIFSKPENCRKVAR